jgi:hypothetical protein
MGGDSFPYHEKYTTFKHYLDNNLHKEVTKQAIRVDLEKKKKLNNVIWLNDHGPDHIKTVIERASHLLNNGDRLLLNAKEIFLLLNAIQLHDVGNFYGRVNHEKKVIEAIRDGLSPALFDATEVKYVNDIASVHGGKIVYKDGIQSKDTISRIQPEIKTDGYDVKLQVLAAILRFADELADDHNRADTKSLNEGKIPKGSEIFHAYASCLDTVRIEHSKKWVELHFKVPKEYTLRKFGKIDGRRIKYVFLIDEIFSRAMKMHFERIYCSKFWKHHVEIEKIWVRIDFYASPSAEKFTEKDLKVHDEITFTLQDHEYPSSDLDIYTMCPSLRFKNGSLINGQNLQNRIDKRKTQRKTEKKTAKVFKKGRK